ncbi:ankyrin repeat ph and sec7 domain containing protein secg-related [Anaeramoeba ignava]|uniref:Ankyrin repeat ph and sec7 domain containing protein secg-related n=1 Tax=Anaeramoeba ignava TaxID=1746090 RepID=A0A9Q0L865_ANAIG|nr:ankyrin repeat ph and sec7 domain containing protein secg-related [Anaeramoeba ignava]
MGNKEQELVKAIESGNLSKVKELVKNKASVNFVHQDTHPLEDAITAGNLDIITFLLENGADPNFKLQYSNIVCSAVERKVPEILDKILEFGGNVDSIDFYGKTALQVASESNLLQQVKVLIKHKANLEATDKGNVALHYAAGKGHVEIIETLIKSGAKIDPRGNGWTPLMKAVACSQVEATKLLLRKGAEADTTDENKTLLDRCNKEIKPLVERILKSKNSLVEDFLEILKTEDNLANDEIKFTDSTIGIHKEFVIKRIGEQNYHNLKKKSELRKKDDIYPFIKWVYGAKYSDILDEAVDQIFVQTLVESFGFDSKFMVENEGKNGLIKLLENLYKDETTKDFVFKTQFGQMIQVHKFVLFVRSGLFRGMFLCAKDDTSNAVTDQTGMSVNAIALLIEFIYRDQIDVCEELEPYLKELRNAVDFFQLNENSPLTTYFL